MYGLCFFSAFAFFFSSFPAVYFAISAAFFFSSKYPAFKAALIAGIGFTAVQYLYLETQVLVAKQNAIYGVLAALPLFMIWLNLGWTIILYGAELSYAFQHANHLNPSEVL